MRYNLRVEWGHTFSDHIVYARDLPTAQRRTEKTFPGVGKWDWRGAIGFADDAKPAEESSISRTEATLKSHHKW